MHKIFLYTLFLTLLSCSGRGNRQDDLNDAAVSFHWLLGKWERIQEKTDRTTYENWTKIDSTHYKGHGFVMKGTDTLWQEEMFILQNDSGWWLAVKTPGNTEEVLFQINEVAKNAFTSENPEHDFPKQIKYWREGAQLNATIAGGEMEVNFEFKPITP